MRNVGPMLASIRAKMAILPFRISFVSLVFFATVDTDSLEGLWGMSRDLSTGG